MTRAETPVPTPVQAALIALGDHCQACSNCRPTWVGDTPVHGKCVEADQLYRLYRAEVRAS